MLMGRDDGSFNQCRWAEACMSAPVRGLDVTFVAVDSCIMKYPLNSFIPLLHAHPSCDGLALGSAIHLLTSLPLHLLLFHCYWEKYEVWVF